MNNALPWDQLADAWAAMEDAARSGTPNLKALTWQKYKESRDHLYGIAATIFACAVAAYSGIDGETPISGYVSDDVWREIARRVGCDIAVEKSLEAVRLAKTALENPFGADINDEIIALRTRLADLERRVDNLTPSVNEPEMKNADATP